MKKAAVWLIVLAVLAVVIFFFGWLQLRLPGDSCAVIFTKTGGFDDRVALPGRFLWRWERLVPTNLTLYRYSLAPHRAEVEIRETLPSAALYSAILPEKPDFSIQATARLEFAVRPEALPRLLREQSLYPADLPEYYRRAAETLGHTLIGLARQGQLTSPADAAREQLAQENPDLRILHLELTELRLPDPDLYALARQSYRDLVAGRDRARAAAEAKLTEDLVREERALDTLAAYGELLNKYPVLLKAMYVRNLSGRELAELPGFDLDKVLAGLEPKAP
jgi:hypothetical protein